jgi:hypothetical protein
VSRPVPLHREKHPRLDVAGCFGCKATGLMFTGVHRLQGYRAEGITEADFKRDIYDNARRTGRDIQRADVTSPSSGGLI